MCGKPAGCFPRPWARLYICPEPSCTVLTLCLSGPVTPTCFSPILLSSLELDLYPSTPVPPAHASSHSSWAEESWGSFLGSPACDLQPPALSGAVQKLTDCRGSLQNRGILQECVKCPAGIWKQPKCRCSAVRGSWLIRAMRTFQMRKRPGRVGSRRGLRNWILLGKWMHLGIV